MSDSAYKRITELLIQRIGLCPKAQGDLVLQSAIRAAAHILERNDLNAFARELEVSPLLWNTLISRVTISETWFFRNPRTYEAVIHSLSFIQAPLRVLCLGCASGEEPYSIAMHALGKGWVPEQVQVDAIDINAHLLELGEKGLYYEHSFRDPVPAFAERYLLEEGAGFRMHPDVRNCVSFEQGNVCNASIWFGRPRYHLIFCRHLLIYLHEEARSHLLKRMKRQLEPGGSLIFGAGESAGLVNLDEQLQGGR